MNKTRTLGAARSTTYITVEYVPQPRRTIARTIDWAVQNLCSATGHMFGCWLLNSRRSPLYRLHVWSTHNAGYTWRRTVYHDEGGS